MQYLIVFWRINDWVTSCKRAFWLFQQRTPMLSIICCKKGGKWHYIIIFITFTYLPCAVTSINAMQQYKHSGEWRNYMQSLQMYFCSMIQLSSSRHTIIKSKILLLQVVYIESWQPFPFGDHKAKLNIIRNNTRNYVMPLQVI